MPARKFTPITRKVNVIIVISLLLGIGGIIVFFSLALIREIAASLEKNLKQHTDTVKVSIRSIMVPGYADIATRYFEEVTAANPDVSVKLFRENGKPAFSDDNTIRTVNENQGYERFSPNEPRIDVSDIPEQPYFKDALTVSPEEKLVSFQTQKGDAIFFTVYEKLQNRPSCMKCHGATHTIRGVICIESNITASINKQTLYLIISYSLFVVLLIGLTVILTQFLRRTVILPVQTIGAVCTNVTAGQFDKRVDIKNNDEIGVLGSTVNQMVQGLYERFKLSKFVSSSTLQSLKTEKAGEKLPLTILFSDIRGFTSYSEKKPPEDVVESLNKMLNFQTEIITENGGDVDKYVGDEIVAIFTTENPELSACRTALLIQKELSEKSGSAYSGLQVGIGINVGEVILGMIGSEKRADYTVIGDNVNTASRLCNAAKAGQIIIAHSIYQRVKASVLTDGPFRVRVKGKDQYLRVYLLKALKKE
ncbi:MAG: adenylate/guanylate cyclase domain-containing protein [Spirochaetales bacterium]|nr:adenylate/guanylate cyclase domain-containing protein [Spirochaetales bacterium]